MLGATINFIGCWLKALEHNFLERCHMYVFTMNILFLKIPVELPKQPSSKEKHQSLSHGIGGGWSKYTTTKEKETNQKSQKEED